VQACYVLNPLKFYQILWGFQTLCCYNVQANGALVFFGVFNLALQFLWSAQRMHSIGGIKYNQIHYYLIEWFEKNSPFFKHVGYFFNPFWGPLMQKKVLGSVTGF
jgi:hypothetical protein